MKSHPYQDIDTMHYHVSVAIYVYEESDAEATNHGADIVGQKVLLWDTVKALLQITSDELFRLDKAGVFRTYLGEIEEDLKPPPYVPAGILLHHTTVKPFILVKYVMHLLNIAETEKTSHWWMSEKLTHDKQ